MKYIDRSQFQHAFICTFNRTVPLKALQDHHQTNFDTELQKDIRGQIMEWWNLGREFKAFQEIKNSAESMAIVQWENLIYYTVLYNIHVI